MKAKKTHKEYTASILRRMDEETRLWQNATYIAQTYTNSPYRNPDLKGARTRYCFTKAEAVAHARWCIKEWKATKTNKVTSHRAGLIGYDVVTDPDTQSRLEVIAWKVAVREVTDWETIENRVIGK